jgi:inner membrane protein
LERTGGRNPMMKRTHIAIGVAAALPIIINNPVSIFGVLGSIVPDWDYILGIKHRTYTHSLLVLFISSVSILTLNKWIALVWLINYVLHLIADSFTKMGTPFLYPWNKKYYGYKLIKTRGAEDYFIQALAIAFIMFVYVA